MSMEDDIRQLKDNVGMIDGYLSSISIEIGELVRLKKEESHFMCRKCGAIEDIKK